MPLKSKEAKKKYLADYYQRNKHLWKKRYKEREPIAGFFYVLDFGEFVKIGVTRDWDTDRRKDYDTLPWKYELKYLQWHENANIMENHMIRNWKKFATNPNKGSEWFKKENGNAYKLEKS